MSIRSKIFKIISKLSVQYTWASLLSVTLITIFLGYYASGLKVSTSVTEVLPTDDKRASNFELIMKEFNNSSNIILVLEGEEQVLKDFSAYIKPRLLEMDEIVDRVDDKIPKQFIIDHSLKLFSSSEIQSFNNLYSNPNLIPFISNLNDSFEKEFIGNDEIENKDKERSAVRFLDGIEKFITIQKQVIDSGYKKGDGLKAVDAITIGEEYILNINKDMLLLMIEPKFNMFDDIYLVIDAVNRIDDLIISEAKDFNIDTGLTGTMVLQRDEMEALKNDSFLMTLLALISIFVLFVIAFKMWSGPTLSIITVVIGIVWALGIVSFLVEHLTMLTSGISIILIGLAIDFSIHIISTFTEFRNKGLNSMDALNASLLKSGPGISTGALTTSMAFFTMIISNNKGMSDMGIVAGVGIVVTMISTITVLPVLLILREKILTKMKVSHNKIDTSYKFLGSLAYNVSDKKIFFAPLVIIITLYMLYNARMLQFDYNILNLEPVGLKSVIYQEKMMKSFDMASDFVMMTSTSLDSMRSLTERVKNMESAGRIESIVDYLPNDESSAENFQFRRNLRRQINSNDIKSKLEIEDLLKYFEEINRLEFNIMELQDLAFLGGQDKIYNKCKILVGEVGDSLINGKLSNFSNQLNGDFNIKYPLTTFHQNFAANFKSRVDEMSNYKPLNIDLITDDIKNRFVSKDGETYLLTIYPNQIVWEDINFLFEFTNESEKISETATGMPPIMVSYMNMMIEDGKYTTWIALFAIFIILMIDMKRIKYAAGAMIPLVFGIIWMMGIMHLFGLKLNMMNIMILPLIMGIGIDDGIHVMHRYIIEKDIMTVFRSTGKAILLTTLTTMLAFGSLYFSTYRGLASLGISLFIGSVCCFLATLFIVPLIFNNKK